MPDRAGGSLSALQNPQLACSLVPSASAWRRSVEHVSVEVVPATVLANETAALVQPLGRAAAEPAARYELDFSVGRVDQPMATNRQPKPGAHAGPIEFEFQRASERMPGGEQVVGQTTYIGTVARSHQRFGIRCRLAAVTRFTAVGVGTATTAVTAAGRLAAHRISRRSCAPPSCRNWPSAYAD